MCIDRNINLYKFFDKIFTCNPIEVQFFKDKFNILHLNPGFDPEISKFIKNEKYECDISIVCTNLYCDKIFTPEVQRIKRKKLVDDLYEIRDKLKFRIYGPNNAYGLNLYQNYPDCYVGPISYENCPLVFSNSKINLNIHMNSYLNNGEEEYFCERIPQILGCQGLLFCETEFKTLIPQIDYILADPDNYINQIIDIIQNNEKYNQIRKNGYEKAIKNLTWDNWAKKIIN